MRREKGIEVPVFYVQNLVTYWQTLEIKEWRIIERIIMAAMTMAYDETINCLQKNPYATIKEKQETSAVEASVSCCHSCSHHRFAAVCE